MLFDGCFVKVEIPVCYYVEQVIEDRVYLVKNPYFGSSCHGVKYQLIQSKSGKVEVYIGDKLYKEFKGCVKVY